MPGDRVLARVSEPFPTEILSVSALNRSVRDLLEHHYPLLWVAGEISNFIVAKSGHAYFSLKDEQAQVRCVMFRNRSQLLDWTPKDGTRVEARALITLYEARGDFQLNVETMRRAGVGALFEAFLRLKDKLEKEGLFAPEIKRGLPAYPKAVGVVTSRDAAALRDVLTTLARRNPAIAVIVYPTPVQGDGAAESIAAALDRAAARGECDVIILCRGGGSIEDLQAFNQEIVARAIRSSPVPVVTGVGHETDFTIADFAADRRAPTPTAAAELASPARGALLERLRALIERSQHRVRRDLEARMQMLDFLLRRLVHPGRRLTAQADTLSQLRSRLQQAARRALEERAWRAHSLAQAVRASLPDLVAFGEGLRQLGRRFGAASSADRERRRMLLAKLAGNLSHLDPTAVLRRGYSIVTSSTGSVVSDAGDISLGEALRLRFARGAARVRVEKKE